jgi:hypothetical protein
MRRTSAAVLFILAAPACVIGESTSGGGDQVNGEGDGTGGGGGGGAEPAPVSAQADRTAVSTQLGKTETLTVTVSSLDGFSGAVDVVPSVVDEAGKAVQGWALTPTPASVELSGQGSAQIQLAVEIPTDAAVLAPKIKVALKDATGKQWATDMISAFQVANQVTINLAATGTAIPHSAWPEAGQTTTIRSGAKVIFHNQDTIPHLIHGGKGIPHEVVDLAPGADYTVTPTKTDSWWCHKHQESPTSGRKVTVIP